MKKHYKLSPALWVLIDGSLATLTTWVAYRLSPYTEIARDGHAEHLPMGWALTAMLVLVPVIAHVLGLHDPLSPKNLRFIGSRAVAVTFVALAILVMGATLIRYARVGRYILMFVSITLPLSMMLVRRAVALWLSQPMKLLLLGEAEERQHVLGLLQQYDVRANVLHEQSDFSALRQHCRTKQIGEIVYCSMRPPTTTELDVLMDCQQDGVQISSVGLFYEKVFYRVPHDRITGLWFLMMDIGNAHSVYHVAKRLFDATFSLFNLLLLSPFLALCCLAIKLETPGPAFYSQLRVGKNGKVFRLWKLRSMYQDAEDKGAQWAAKRDSRVTRIGAVLRKTRFDEVPQFWNILQGDMSFVGPRPERPEFITEIEKQVPFYRQRHLLKPGLTGWAQINYPYGASIEDAAAKLQLDLYYIKNISLALDLQITLRTLGVVMKGAR